MSVGHHASLTSRSGHQGTPPREVADTIGVSVHTLYRWVPATGATEAPRSSSSWLVQATSEKMTVGADDY